MEAQSVARIKCAMVVYELERSLGRYIRDKGSVTEESETVKTILTRSGSDTQLSSVTRVRNAIENSFLGEIFSMAIACAKHTSDALAMTSLERLCLALDLFDIRNAISHPNRVFPDCYWYRCAAIAADPSVDTLGLYEVVLAFKDAEQGSLKEPPDEWMYKKRWSVPSLLPEEFEHSVTGLVGRSKDTQLLTKALKNRKSPLIAIVAQGGVGKTSLMLQVVSDFCLSTESAEYFDGTLWTSLKQERLTSKGIQILSAPASLDEMKNVLSESASSLYGDEFESFDDMVGKLKDKRILLCLDNLETLLRDSPFTFNTFYDDLPDTWKVIVTSRIAVDNAKNVPLGQLESQGATVLARNYLDSKGHHQNPVDQTFLERIVSGCRSNPLAIRIAIDLYASGASIAEALLKSEKDVLSFSFTSLLDHLSPLENHVLETAFALERPTRSHICGALNCSVDEAAEAISRLSKTSLLTRVETANSEVYALGDSIRDLLRAHPRDLRVRSLAAQWLIKSNATAESAKKLQIDQNVSPVDFNYIPQDAPSSLISISRRLSAAIRREDRATLVQIEADLRQQLFSDSSAFLCRLYARTTLELDDVATADSYFQKAAGLDPEDPAAGFGMAITSQMQNRPDLYTISKKLIESGWGSVEKSGYHYANRIWSLFLYSANVAGKYQEVFLATANFENQIDSLPSLALGRASAHRRLADDEFTKHACGTVRLGELLGKASYLLHQTLAKSGFKKWVTPELKKLVGEISFYKSKGIDVALFIDDDQKRILDLLNYLMKNLGSLERIDYSEIEKTIQYFAKNELPQSGWIDYDVRKSQLEKNGYTIARVKHGLTLERKYVFVQDKFAIDYFVKLAVFENGDALNWNRLLPGLELAIKYDPTHTGNAFRATEAWLVAN
jgi:hypothetical protein